MTKVMHLITGLGTGGAEINLYKLVRAMDRSRFENSVVSILPAGPIGTAITACSVPVTSLNVKRGIPNPIAIVRLWRLLRQWKPDVLQTWMYHSDLLGGITAKISSGPPVVWNIRHSVLQRSNGALTFMVAHLCARLSSWLPAAIVCCSKASEQAHSKLGYNAAKMVVIFNGYDSGDFRPDPQAAARLRTELALNADAVLVENIGRFDPQKDHRSFLSAARVVRNADRNATFIMCGDGITWQNSELVEEIKRQGLKDCVHLLGRRTDVNRIMAAASVVVSSSCSEGFPNVIAEAMACGASCVVTDVGDPRYIVGDAGIVVPPNDPARLAEGVIKALQQNANSAKDGLPGRERIARLFDLRSTVEQYEQLYERVSAAGLS